jgi:hypothetical protein
MTVVEARNAGFISLSAVFVSTPGLRWFDEETPVDRMDSEGQ